MDSKQGEKDFNFQLIAYVKQNEELYNPNNPSHKDNALKMTIYQKFAEQHRVDTDFVGELTALLEGALKVFDLKVCSKFNRSDRI